MRQHDREDQDPGQDLDHQEVLRAGAIHMGTHGNEEEVVAEVGVDHEKEDREADLEIENDMTAINLKI